MKRLLAALKRLGVRRVVRTVAVVIGVLLLALLIWVLGPVIAIAGVAPLGPVWARLVAILLLAAVVLIIYLRRRRGRAKKSADLAADLAKPPPPDEADVLSKEDLKAMEERADAALKLMKSTRVGAEREYIYELPWYLIIGPPGAGKTTALHNAGLKFPVAQELGAAPVLGIGGTRTCEWWFTDQAVLIDTAGRYTTQDSHQEADAKAWGGFLSLLGRYRPRQPITGLIVAVSVADLIEGGEKEVAAHGRAIRSRINEVAEKLGVRAPVYVILTKMDLLGGFTEFFEDVGQTERDQVWGHTFDIEASREGKTTGAAFEPAFDTLVERLNDRLLGRVQAENDIQRRAAIFGFPQEFANLLGPLSALLHIVGRESKFEPTPMIRGVYFTSATQLGRPIDRVVAAVAAKFGVVAAAASDRGAAGRSYFLRDLLTTVIFGEASLADRDPRTEKRRRWLRLGSIGAGAALLLILSAAWLQGYFRSAHLLKDLEAKAAHLQVTASSLPAGEISDSDMKAVLPALEEARALPYGSTAPVPFDKVRWTFGMSHTHAVRAQVDAAYANLLQHQMLPRLMVDLEDQLRAAVRSSASDTRQQTYALLRIYLMLGRAPKAPLERSQIVAWFDAVWANRYPSAEDDPVRAALQRHLETLLSSRLSPPALDRALVETARLQVKSLSPGERAYSRMASDPALADLPPFSLSDVADVSESGLFVRKSGKSLALGVPGMYRRQTFYANVVPEIGKAAAQSVNESWVTDEKAIEGALPVANEVGRLKDEILIAYLKDFTRQWDDFINDLAISSDHSPRDRIAIAVRPPSPVKLLLNTLASETNLTPPSIGGKGVGGGAAAMRVASIFSQRIYRGMQRANYVGSAFNTGQGGSGPPGPLDEVIAHFKWLSDMNPAQGPSPIDQALQALATVGDASLSAQAASGLGDPVLQRTKTSTAMEATAKLDQASTTLPPVVRAMFTGFVKSSATALNQSAKQSLQQQYTSQILPQCQNIVRQGFPFNDDQHEVSIDDLSRLFRPGGLIDQFVQTNLSGMIDTNARTWTPTPAGKALGLQQASVGEFQRADRIKRRLFQPGDVRPNVRFVVEATDVQSRGGSVALSIDGQPAAFEQTNRKPVEVRWPGPSPGVSISFPRPKGAPALKTWAGDFAMSRMLESAKVTSTSTRSMSFHLDIDQDGAGFTLRFLNTDNPFDLKDLRAFRCPGGL